MQRHLSVILRNVFALFHVHLLSSCETNINPSSVRGFSVPATASTYSIELRYSTTVHTQRMAGQENSGNVTRDSC